MPVLSPTRHCLLCDVFAVYKHGVTHQAHSVVYIFLFFHSVIMASTCILMLSLPVIGTVPVGLSAHSPTGTPLSLTSCTHRCYLLCRVGGLLFQQEAVQAIGIYPGNFTKLADALLSCGELTSILRLLAFSQALVSSCFPGAGRSHEYKAVLLSVPNFLCLFVCLFGAFFSFLALVSVFVTLTRLELST